MPWNKSKSQSKARFGLLEFCNFALCSLSFSFFLLLFCFLPFCFSTKPNSKKKKTKPHQFSFLGHTTSNYKLFPSVFSHFPSIFQQNQIPKKKKPHMFSFLVHLCTLYPFAIFSSIFNFSPFLFFYHPAALSNKFSSLFISFLALSSFSFLSLLAFNCC